MNLNNITHILHYIETNLDVKEVDTLNFLSLQGDILCYLKTPSIELYLTYDSIKVRKFDMDMNELN